MGRGWGQSQRVSAGEPAHGARQVDLVKQRFAAMPFQLNQRRGLSGPTAHHPRQRRQQHIIDLGAVSTRCVLQQLARVFGAQAHADRLPMPVLPCALRVIAWQLSVGPRELLLPQAKLLAQ